MRRNCGVIMSDVLPAVFQGYTKHLQESGSGNVHLGMIIFSSFCRVECIYIIDFRD